MATTKLLANLHLLTPGVWQVYVWRDEDGITLLDAGAAEVAGWGHVEVLAHAQDAPIILGEQAGPAPNFTEAERVLHAQVAHALPPAPPCRVDRELVDGEVLDIAGGALVVATPGHTDGSMALFFQRQRVLFTGDTVAEYHGQIVLGPFNLDRDRAARSFRALAELDADVACFGHGRPVVGDASATLARTLPRIMPAR